MSDPTQEPTDDEITYADARKEQADLEGLIDERDGDFQEAVDAQQAGAEPDEPRPQMDTP